MPDHKFEPFQRVLVRGVTGIWLPDLYGCEDVGATKIKHLCTGGISYEDIVPYTPETAHLLGTTQPYDPHKPPQEYDWGQKVEVFDERNWCVGIYVHPIAETARWHSVLVGESKIAFIETNIRPLTT